MKNRNSIAVLFDLIALVKKYIVYMIIAIITGVLGFLSAILIPVFGIYGVLIVLGISTTFTLKTLGICVMVVALLRGPLHYIEQACNHYIAFRILAEIRDKVFFALRKLAPAKLDSKERGSLISLVTSDIELLEVFYAHTLSPVVIAFIVSLVMIVYIGSINWILAIIPLIAYITIGVFIPKLVSRKANIYGEAFREKFASMNTYFLDSIRGLREIIQFNMGDERLKKVNDKSREMLIIEGNLSKNIGLTQAFVGLLVTLFSFAMLFVSIYLYQCSQLKPRLLQF